MLAGRKPYGEWLENNLVRFEHRRCAAGHRRRPDELDILTLTQRQIAFGYSSEELDIVLKPMFKDGAEAVGSMGDDTPLAVLSLRPRLLYTYFKQLFAQVTNPPIDPIREKLVMSLHTVLGWRRNLLSETPEHCRQIILESPVLLDAELEKLDRRSGASFRRGRFLVSGLSPKVRAGLKTRFAGFVREAEEAVDGGIRLLVLSDRGVDFQNVGGADAAGRWARCITICGVLASG